MDFYITDVFGQEKYSGNQLATFLHCELPRAQALSVEGETGQCYVARLCLDKLRPAAHWCGKSPFASLVLASIGAKNGGGRYLTPDPAEQDKAKRGGRV